MEVDLLLFKDHYLMVEVKTLRSLDEMGFRVSQKQRSRLEFARHFLEDLKNKSVLLKYAFVCRTEIVVLGTEDF